jgi:hypothetical protein
MLPAPRAGRIGLVEGTIYGATTNSTLHSCVGMSDGAALSIPHPSIRHAGGIRTGTRDDQQETQIRLFRNRGGSRWVRSS